MIILLLLFYLLEHIRLIKTNFDKEICYILNVIYFFFKIYVTKSFFWGVKYCELRNKQRNFGDNSNRRNKK